MENHEIIEHIVHGGNYYLDILAMPSNKKKNSDEYCTWIKPKEGIKHGPIGVYKINFGNKTDDEIRQIVQKYRDNGVPNYWFITPLSVPNHLRNILQELNVTVGDNKGMAILPEQYEQTRHNAVKCNSQITVKRVRDKHDFITWANIANTALFEEPMCDPEQYYPLCNNGIIKCFLGYFNDKPVSTSMVFKTDNGIGRLDWISTLPDYRKKGIGTAVCLAGMEQLIKDDAFIITLCATQMGVSLYESLGFKIYF
jgi:GNAT superfamily N-acetyltransferase